MSRRKKTLDKPKRLRQANPFKTTVADYFGPYSTRVEGAKIGIEIEVESANNHYAQPDDYWKVEHDGSLRGPNGERDGGREYVSRRPITFTEAREALEGLDAGFRKSRVKNTPSVRTSVHVHLNVQHLTLTQLVNLLCLYYVAEPVLCRYNGAARENNLFAMQLMHAPMIIEEITQSFSSRMVNGGRDALKYSALNLMPLFANNSRHAFGTIEFRAGRGIQTKPSDCYRWVQMVEELYHKSLEFTTADDIVTGLSAEGVQGFLAKNLPGIYEETYGLFEPEELNATVIDSMRASQELAFGIDWTDYVPTSKKKLREPFEDGLPPMPTQILEPALQEYRERLHTQAQATALNTTREAILTWGDYPPIPT